MALQKEIMPSRAHLLKLATYSSVCVAILLIVIKAVVWFMSGSVSILASLVDSLMDAGASVLNLLAVRLALQPADHEHRFGHGKAEGIAALFQAAFIMGSALFLLLNAIDRIRHPSELHITPVVFAVMLASLVITIALVAFQQWILKQAHSSAVAADRLHYLTDILSNIAVLIALGVSLYGWHQADAIIGIGLALWIGWSAIGIGREALNMLMDKALPDTDLAAINSAVLQTKGVLGMHDLRTRLSGETRIIQCHIEVQDNLPLLQAHDIAVAAEHNIAALFEDSEIIIHLDPLSVVNTHTTTDTQGCLS